MDPERWTTIQSLFAEALEQEPEERSGFLDSACADESVRSDVAELLAAHDDDDGPIDYLGRSWTPASEMVNVPPTSAENSEVAGRRIGPYRLIRRLGRGGMGEVFLAERADGQFDRQVALKLLRDGLHSESMKDRFLAEQRTLARLEHPGIARLIDGGLTADGRPFFAMEAVQGERIDHYCDRHQLDLNQRLALFNQVCAAVHHAHQRLVVHRDLKPSNIFVVANDGQANKPIVKLLDFGIARLLGDSAGDQRTSTRLFTPEYAAPEQITGGEISTATDIYALGVVLYEMLTGHRPHALENLAPGEVVKVICEHEPPPPSSVVFRRTGTTVTEVPDPVTPASLSRDRRTEPETLVRLLRGDLDTICLKALDKDPTRRYASAEAFLDDVKRHLDGMPVSARPATSGYRVRKFVRRHSAGVAGSALAVVLLLGSLAGMTWQAARAANERDRAQAETSKAEQVSTFLQTLLNPIGAFEAGMLTGDSSLTVLEVVRRASASIDADLADQPEVLAAVHRSLGLAFEGLGLLDEAGLHLQAALAIRDSLFHGQAHPDRIQSADDLAYYYAERYDWAPSDSLLRLSIALRRQRFGPRSLELADSYHTFVSQRPFRLRRKRESRLLREAYEIWAALDLPVESGHQFRLALAIDHLEGRRYAEADSAFAAIEADLDRYANPNPFTRAELLNHWSAVGILAGDYEAAQAHIEAALAILEARLRPTHPNVQIARSLQAPILVEQRAYADAESILRAAVTTLREVAPNSWVIPGDEAERGAALAGLGRDLEAEPLMVRNLAELRTRLGDRHHWVPHMAQHLVDFYDTRGRPRMADPYRELTNPAPRD